MTPFTEYLQYGQVGESNIKQMFEAKGCLVLSLCEMNHKDYERLFGF